MKETWRIKKGKKTSGLTSGQETKMKWLLPRAAHAERTFSWSFGLEVTQIV